MKTTKMAVSYTNKDETAFGFYIVDTATEKRIFDSGLTYTTRKAARNAGDIKLAFIDDGGYQG